MCLPHLFCLSFFRKQKKRHSHLICTTQKKSDKNLTIGGRTSLNWLCLLKMPKKLIHYLIFSLNNYGIIELAPSTITLCPE